MFLKVGDVFELRDRDCVTHSGSIVNVGNLSGGNYYRYTSGHIDTGTYVVVSTGTSGGGTAMFNDRYPNGYSVVARELKEGEWDPEGKLIQFYQSGAFCTLIKNREIIGKMKMIFVRVE